MLDAPAATKEVTRIFQPATEATSTKEWLDVLRDATPNSCIIASTKPDDLSNIVDIHSCLRYKSITKAQILAIEKATVGQARINFGRWQEVEELRLPYFMR